jgi:hypothetical protein
MRMVAVAGRADGVSRGSSLGGSRPPSEPAPAAAGGSRPKGAVGCYRDPTGVQRTVVVRELAGGRWRIYDVPPRGERSLVEELFGDGESRGSAMALALDYLRKRGGSQ